MTHDIDEARPLNPGRIKAERDAALARVAELEAENCALSAWQCVFTDGTTGLTSGDRGHQFCAMLARAERAEARIKELEAALRAYACDCTGDGACPTELEDLLGCGMIARQALAGTKKPPA